MTQTSAQGEVYSNGDGADGSADRPPSDPTGYRTEGSEHAKEKLPLDEVFGILKNRRRRYVLQYLAETEGQVTIGETAEQIAAWENDKPVSQITSSERKRVYVGLYQSHLPKMDGIGAVSFNKPRGIIEPGENAEVFYRYLNNADADAESPLFMYSIPLAAGGGLILGAAMVLSAMTPVQLTGAAAGLIVVGSLAYAVAAYKRLEEDEDATQGESAA